MNVNGLPIFESDSVVWLQQDLFRYIPSETIKSTGGWLIRYARLPNPNYFTDVHAVLDAADSTFDAIGAACGLEVIDHEWGAAKIPERLPEFDREMLASKYLPPNYSLAARVGVIINKSEITKVEHKQIQDKIADLDLQFRWDDDGCDQFTRGCMGGSGRERVVYLHDIEPRIVPIWAHRNQITIPKLNDRY